MKYTFQKNLRSPGLIKRKSVDPERRSFIAQSMDSFLGMEDDISLEDLQDTPPVTKPSIQKPGALTKDDRSTSTEVTTGLDDSSVTSFDLTEMDRPFTVLPVSPFGEVLDYQEHWLDNDDDCSTHSLNVVEKPHLEKHISIESSVDSEDFLRMPDLRRAAHSLDDDDYSTHSLNVVQKPRLKKHVSIESVDIDEFLGMPDLPKIAPPMRRTSITIPVPPLTDRPQRRSSVSFAEVAEVSFIDKLDDTTDYDSLYYTEEQLANFRHQAFLEQCGISEEDFV